MNYSQEDINQILLTKKIEDFNLAIIEHRKDILTNEEYEKITGSDITYTGVSKEEIDSISKKYQDNEKLKNRASDFMRLIYSLGRIRRMVLLTTIGDEVYDILNSEFVDLKRNKIICYENLTNYYDDTNARTKLFTPEEEPQLKEKLVLLDADDPSRIQGFETNHINQKENKDLTRSFLSNLRENQNRLLKTRKFKK